jgi:hypothetical protein
MNFPIYGSDEAEARQRAGFLLDDVLYIAKTFYGGEGVVGNIIPDSKKRIALAMMHLAGHWEAMSLGLSTIERTAEEYKFLKQFGISNVAQIIAHLEGVQPAVELILVELEIGQPDDGATVPDSLDDLFASDEASINRSHKGI